MGAKSIQPINAPEVVTLIKEISPQEYQSHRLHDKSQDWPETNCYIDVWIELLHFLKLNPLAMLGIGITIDFDGDQWTFFKPSHEDLYELYGLRIEELNIWKSLFENAHTQLARGRFVLTEVDAFYLPDTVATDYKQKHTKTTIALQKLDPKAKFARYFHNAGFYQLEGEDFEHIFYEPLNLSPPGLPLFAEFVRLDKMVSQPPETLTKKSLKLLQRNLERLPQENPFKSYKKQFLQDLNWIKEGAQFDPQNPMGRYHAYAFAHLRQFGSAFSMLGHHLEWLSQHPEGVHSRRIEPQIAQNCHQISTLAKSLLMKTARAFSSAKPIDFDPLLGECGRLWEDIVTGLCTQIGSPQR